MFFTRIGKVIAQIMLALGILRIAMGLFVAFATPDMESNGEASADILAAASSGEAIDEGIKWVFFSVALGVLCEISSKRNRPDKQT
jgi:hypothetical protein